jgi:hypothetical protein
VEKCAANCKSSDEPDDGTAILLDERFLCKYCVEFEVNAKFDNLVQSVAETESHHDRFQGLSWAEILEDIEHELRLESDGRDNYRRDWWIEDRLEEEKKSGSRECEPFDRLTAASTTDDNIYAGTSNADQNLDDIDGPHWDLLDIEGSNLRKARTSTPVPEFDPFLTPLGGCSSTSTKIQDDNVALVSGASQFGGNVPIPQETPLKKKSKSTE